MVRDVDLVRGHRAGNLHPRLARAPVQGDAQFYTWLYRIAVNTAKKALMDLQRSAGDPSAASHWATTRMKLLFARTN
jgi:RNA polymerase sigma-70 factor (ECF subfamily)